MGDIKITKGAAILLVICIALVMVFIVMPNMPDGGDGNGQQNVWYLDGVRYTDWNAYYQAYIAKFNRPPDDTPPQPTRDASKIQFTVQNFIDQSGVAGTTTEVDVLLVRGDGVVDFLDLAETIAVASNPGSSSLYYAEGQTLILHVLSDTDPTSGTDHYDGWYWVKLEEGEHVHYFDTSCVTVKDSNPYTYTFKGGGPTIGAKSIVKFTSGDTNYWDFGVVYVYPRISAANLNTYFKGKGVTLSSCSGTGYDDTVGEVDANHTMTSTNEDFYVSLIAGAVDLTYGMPFYAVTQQGEFQERRAVIVFSTDMTDIDLTTLYNEGWESYAKSTLTSEVAFYKVIGPLIPTRGDTFEKDYKVPVDAGAAASGTEYIFKAWIIDLQVPSYCDSGSTTSSVPTAYGMCNEYGIDAIIFARELQVSSGAGDNEILRTYITTP